MIEEASKSNASDSNADARQEDNSNASNRFLNELMSASADSRGGLGAETLRLQQQDLDITDCYPDLKKYPTFESPIDKLPIDKSPIDKSPTEKFPIDQYPVDKQSTERQIYIPSPDSVAPIMLPGFFEQYPKSSELDKVGEDADKLAQLMKSNASPEEKQKAWASYEASAKNVHPNLAALRLNLALHQQEVPGSLSAKVNGYDGKLSLIDYGAYEPMGKLDYKTPDQVDFRSSDLDPDLEKATSDFAQRLQKGVSSEELKELLSGLLDKMSAANMDSSSATSAIYWALSREPGNKYDALNISREPSFLVDGKPVRVYVNAMIFDKEVSLGITPEPRKLFG